MHRKSGSVCRDGTLFVDVCCDRCHCQDYANQFHLLPGRKHFGSVESLVHFRKNVVSHNRSHSDVPSPGLATEKTQNEPNCQLRDPTHLRSLLDDGHHKKIAAWFFEENVPHSENQSAS